MNTASDFGGCRSLYSGGVAEYHPDSDVVEFSLSADEIAAFDAGRSLSSALKASTAEQSVGSIFEKVPDPVKRFTAAIKHEHDHSRRHLGTSYGLFTEALHGELAYLFTALADEHASAGEGPLFPLIDTPLAEAVCQGAAKGHHNRRARAWLAWEALGSALSRDISAEAFGLVDELLHELMVEGTTYRPSSEVESFVVGGRSSPPYLLEGERIGLAAHHILEFFGIGEEGNGLLTMAGTDAVSRVGELLLERSRRYSFLTVLWGLGEDFATFASPTEQARDEHELMILYYRLWPMELHAIADLAVWVPVTPEGFTSRRGAITWEDISPGHRFVRALRYVKERHPGWSPIPGSADEKNAKMAGLQGEICTELGWPTPEDLSGAWLEATGIRESSKRLLTLRRERPGEVLINSVDFNAAGVERPGAWIYAGREGVAMRELSRVRDGGEMGIDRFLLRKGLRALTTRWGPSEQLWGFARETRERAVEAILAAYRSEKGEFPRQVEEGARGALLLG